ncbi:MAG TPA: hypothetical protein VHC70_01600, partial [Phycisphaerales bacterium]|nr:hypothetical protein [Phycisphaerales bacterium]
RVVVWVWDKLLLVVSDWRWAIGAGVCIGGALMTKPLIGLGLPALGLAWLALAGMLTRRSAMIVLVSGAVGLLIALPWHVSMLAQYGESFSHVYFWEQSFQRATGERFHHRPWDWYFQLIAGRLDESINPGLMWPLYASAIAGLAVVAARWRSGVHRVGDALAAVWTLAWFIALCVFSAKQNYYLLVVHPGAAWLSAIAVAVGAKRVGAVVRPALARAAVVLAGVAAVAVAAVSSVKYVKDVPRSLPDDQRALVRFMAEHRGEAFYNGGLAYPEVALLYLKTGVWVRSLVEKAPVAPALVPSGALMVYREDHPASTSADPADPEVFNAPLGGGTYTVRRRHGDADVK